MGTGLGVAAREVAFVLGAPLFRRAVREGRWDTARRLWMNPSAADPSLLAAIAEAADGRPTLECGSGLTSVVLGRGDHTAMEQSAQWCATNRRRSRIASTAPHIVHVPLRSYGDFDWYDIASMEVRHGYGVVVCDGPPRSTRGGRYGLLPVMGDRLAGARVFLDDVDRPGEQAILNRWRSGFDVTVRIISPSNEKTFAIVDIG